MKTKRIIWHILIVLLLSTMSGLIYNSWGENTVSLIYNPPQFIPGKHLSLDQTFQIYREGRALFIDTRYKEEFQEGHIKNALNLPFKSSMDDIMAFLQNIKKEEIIVTYCSNPYCQYSRRMARFLLNQGFQNVYVFLDGYDAWKANNLPVEAYE
jgi:rhodanese-related sulfurtransferase